MLSTSMLRLAFLAILPITSLAAPAASSIPACNSTYDYKARNPQLHDAMTLQLSKASAAAQAASASSYILGNDGYGKDIPALLAPLVESMQAVWIPAIENIKIKCAVCKLPNGKLAHQHVHDYPVMSYQNLYNLFRITTSMLYEIDTKQCSIPGFTPAAEVKAAMRPFLKAALAGMGIGADVAKANKMTGNFPDGAVLPYYQCLKDYATSNISQAMLNVWLPLNSMLMKLNSTGCV